MKYEENIIYTETIKAMHKIGDSTARDVADSLGLRHAQTYARLRRLKAARMIEDTGERRGKGAVVYRLTRNGLDVAEGRAIVPVNPAIAPRLTKFEILEAVCNGTARTITDAAEYVGVGDAAASRALQWLVNHGMVERRVLKISRSKGRSAIEYSPTHKGQCAVARGEFPISMAPRGKYQQLYNRVSELEARIAALEKEAK